MDEVKIWAIEDTSTIVELQSRGRMEAESLLEDTLVANPDLLLPGLKLVGRQIPTAGGPLDLLGVDEDGRLSLFELKRGTLTREAVAQVIDYAADLEDSGLRQISPTSCPGSRAGTASRGSRTSRNGTGSSSANRSRVRGGRCASSWSGWAPTRERSGWLTSWPTTAAWTSRSSPFMASSTAARSFIARQVHVEGTGRCRGAPEGATIE